jgi:hypothetical protein
MGTFARKAKNAGPAMIGPNTGPAERVPSAKSTTGSPPVNASSQIRRASRSGVPRRTGKPPRELNNFAAHGLANTPDLPIKRTRRRVTYPVSNVSMYERWTGARM